MEGLGKYGHNYRDHAGPQLPPVWYHGKEGGREEGPNWENWEHKEKENQEENWVHSQERLYRLP